MPTCPACGRTLAVARPACLYCGRALGDSAPRERDGAAPDPAPERDASVLVLVELWETAPASLAAALAVSSYQATLLARRGGLHLARRADPEAAEAEARRLRESGVRCWLVPESEARALPLACLGGELRGERLLLSTTREPVTLARGDALLIVRGPIARQYQALPEPRRISSARLEEGFRIHVHRHADPHPLEIDVLNFEPGLTLSGSARLEIDAWLDAVAGEVPRDDAFSRLPPVLAPAAPEPPGRLAAAGSLATSARGAAAGGRPLALDNLAQFRLYSGCLAAVARRRAPGATSRG